MSFLPKDPWVKILYGAGFVYLFMCVVFFFVVVLLRCRP